MVSWSLRLVALRNGKTVFWNQYPVGASHSPMLREMFGVRVARIDRGSGRRGHERSLWTAATQAA